MKKLSLLKYAPLLLAGSLLATGCDDPEEPGGPGEEELITQVVITLTPIGGGASMSATIEDPDGNGPMPPEPPTQTLTLTQGGTYDGMIQFFDASDPADVESITEEVEEEDDAHRVFYTVAGLTGVDIPDGSLDTDANGAPLGLTFQVEVDASASGTGTIQVVLSHYDEEPKGDGSTPSNETDADVTFTATVQ